MLNRAQRLKKLMVSGPVYGELRGDPARSEEELAEFFRSTGIAIDWILHEDDWREAGRRRNLQSTSFRRSLTDQNCKRQTSNYSFRHYTVCMSGNDLRIGAFKPRSIVLEKVAWVRGLVCLALVASVPFAAGTPQSSGNGLPYPPREPGLPPMNQTANPTADANRLMVDSMKQQSDLKRFELINLQRQKEMTSDTEKLVELAHQLKTETDKDKPETLSILEIRQAELIEKLAHSIHEKMRKSVSN